MKQIIVNSENLQTRIALTADGRIEEYYLERQNSQRIVGSIFKGRIRNLEPSLQAAFVDIGLDKNAFLHYWDMIPATKEILEAEGEAESAAAAEPATDNPSDNSRGANTPASGRGQPPAQPPASGHNPDTPEQGRQAPNPQKAAGEAPAATGKSKPAPAKKGGVTATIKKLFSGAVFGGKAGAGDQERQVQADASPSQPQKHDDRARPAGRNGRDQQRRRGRRPRESFDIAQIPKRFTVNSEVVVQVSKGMIGGKGPRVTTNLSIPGRYVVLLPNSSHRGVSRRIADRAERSRLRQLIQKLELPQGMGLICRTAGEGLNHEAIALDVQLLLEKWEQAERLKRRRSPVCVYQEPGLLERGLRDFLCEQIDEIVVDSRPAYELSMQYVEHLEKSRRPRVKLYDNPRPIFEAYKLNEQIRNIFQRRVPLKSGAELCIDETEALIAIDINSGRSRGGKDHPETILETNLEAAVEVGRQLKLRNLGGLIVVDFIDMRSRRDREKVYRRLNDILARDRAKSKLLAISRLGLLEMTRQRQHGSLQNAVYENCHYCRGRGLVKSSIAISVEIQRRLQEILRRDKGNKTPIRVTVHPRVLQRLRREDARVLEEMESEYGGNLSFRGDPDVHQEEFHLINSSTGEDI